VRKFGRELGVDLARVQGTGPKGRILLEDVQGFVKGVMAGSTVASAAAVAGTGMGMSLLPWPSLDFSKFGETLLEY
jgi:pyruvate dehydrogenase E2 component (dihydrolipoamide acetyltransferase)